MWAAVMNLAKGSDPGSLLGPLTCAASDSHSVLTPDVLSVGRALPCSLPHEAAGRLSETLVQGAWHGARLLGGAYGLAYVRARWCLVVLAAC